VSARTPLALNRYGNVASRVNFPVSGKSGSYASVVSDDSVGFEGSAPAVVELQEPFYPVKSEGLHEDESRFEYEY